MRSASWERDLAMVGLGDDDDQSINIRLSCLNLPCFGHVLRAIS